LKINNFIRSKSLSRIFVINYMYTIIFIIILILFIFISIWEIVNTMYVSKAEERLMEEEFFAQNYQYLNIDGIVEVGGWIETIANNKAITVV